MYDLYSDGVLCIGVLYDFFFFSFLIVVCDVVPWLYDPIKVRLKSLG